jgi:hypothetical protein
VRFARFLLCMQMTRSVFVKFSIMLALVVAGLAVIIAFPAEADKSQVEFESSLTVPVGEYRYVAVSVFWPESPESALYVAYFEVVGGGVVKFYAFSSGAFEAWVDGRYQLSWVSGSGGQCGFFGTSRLGGSFEDVYLVVLNDVASASQNVDLRVDRVWHESSRLGIIVGSVVFSLAVGLIPVLFYGVNRLHAEYSVLLSVMAWILVFSVAMAPYSITPRAQELLIYSLIMTVPGVLFFEAFPLIGLLYLLEKHDGFAFLRSWNMRERLQVVGVFLIFGFCIPIVFMLFRMVSMSSYWPVNPDVYTLYPVAAGLLLMLVGAVVLAVLYIVRVRDRSVSAVAGSG